jgi:Entner-Doudoroff aldolase
VTPSDVVERLREERALAILRTPHAALARPALEAAVAGGFRILEVTLNTPDALARIAELARHSTLVVGAGTVLDADAARRAVDAGARFLVSPVVDPGVIAEAERLGVAMIPGGHSPTELWSAWKAGAPLQKLFPAPVDGPAFVRACLGPMPFLRIVPTSGVSEDNAVAYLEAGAHAVGFVSTLFAPEDVANARFDAIEARAKLLLARVQSVSP